MRAPRVSGSSEKVGVESLTRTYLMLLFPYAPLDEGTREAIA